MKRPPRGKAGWARYFSDLLEKGHPEAAAALRDLAAAEPEKPAIAARPPKKLPRGVYEKVPGSGDYWIRYTDPEGKLRRQRIGPSLSAASELVEQRRTEVRIGKFDPSTVGRKAKAKAMTVRMMFETYLPLRVDVRNKGEDQRYAAYWSKLFGTRELAAVTPLELERWRAERIKQVKPATANRALEYLRAYYYLAQRDGRCTENPAAKVGLLRENNERHRYLEAAEEQQLETKMLPEDFDKLVFAIYTGVRRGEQFKLRWADVDIPRKRFKLPETKAGTHRFVLISDKTMGVLRRQMDRSGQGVWVFPSPTRPDRPMNGDWFVKRVYKPALRAAGISGITWHDLRHTFASRLAEKGHSLHTIGTLLGNVTPSMAKRYANLSGGHLAEAVNSISTLPAAETSAAD